MSQRKTRLDDPVCPTCRSAKDLYDTEDPNVEIGLLECTFCDIRFWFEEITDREEEVDDSDATNNASSADPVDTPGLVDLVEPVLGDITEITESNCG